MNSSIIRKRYLDRIRPSIGKDIIKVLTGQRRVGKSTILKQIIDIVRQEVVNPNIIYLNKELPEVLAQFFFYQ